MHKEWTDAFRESFPQEARPAAGGWEAVAGRLRRAAARRRAAIAAAALALPIAGGVFFLSSGPRAGRAPDAIGIVEPSGLVADVPAAREALPSPADIPESPVSEGTSESPASAEASGSAARQDDPDVSRPEESHPDSVPASTPSDAATPKTAPSAVISDLPAFPDGDLASEVRTRRVRRLTAGLIAGATAGGAPTSATISSMAPGYYTKASNSNFWNNTSGVIFQKEYVHDLPKTLGLTVRYGLTGRLSLESGLEYTYLHSRYDDLHSVMHFAGIPLRLDYSLFTAGPADFYAGLGGKAEKCFKATLGGMAVSEDRIQWSASVLAGAQMRIFRGTWLYLQPDLTYYFTGTTLISYRTDNRLGFTLNAGLRFNIQ